MRRAELAKKLISTRNEKDRRLLLSENVRLADIRLAEEIRRQCYAAWTVDPVAAQQASAALKTLLRTTKTDAVSAIAHWVEGISDITKGRFEAAARSLDKAFDVLTGMDRAADAAQTRVAKLMALAMLGRYDEALDAGLAARKIFVAKGDDLDAGKIEINMSNILSRQSLHRESERFCLKARSHFIKAGERRWQVMAENGLAITYTELNDFKKAERFYTLALAGAHDQKMSVTEAEIQASLGNLALIRGRYADALRYLESSRQKYARLGMPHQSAVADLEIADIYTELNLLPEALEIYRTVAPIFRNLKLRREQARARLNYGRTAARLGEPAATRELDRALHLFEQENNVSGQVAAMLVRAETEIGRRRFDRALRTLAHVTVLIRSDENPRHVIGLKLLEGEAYAGLGQTAKAEASLTEAAAMAQKRQQVNSLQSAWNSLGVLASGRGEMVKARAYFSKAVAIVDDLRSPLASDEFSMAFLASRLAPFENLAQLHLSEGRVADAFRAIERGRSRTLLDALDRGTARKDANRDLRSQWEGLRRELNFYYTRLGRLAPEEAGRLQNDIRDTEARLVSVARQISSLSTNAENGRRHRTEDLDLSVLKDRLGSGRSLIEFIEIGQEVAAFIIDHKKIRFVRGLGTTDDVSRALEDLHFQFGGLRYGLSALSRFLPEMKRKTKVCLMRLYDQLLRPIEKHLKGDHLVIVPAGPLHYVPFSALHDGNGYLIERFETSSAPSAAVWSRLTRRTPKTPRDPLLVGFADEKIPLVENEVHRIGRIFPGSKTLTGKGASFSAFSQSAAEHDLIHLACHGQFRPENPMFSSLHLADGWITVNDICSQTIKAQLVTLSACETGLSKLFPGDEVLGLVRGFLMAGAGSMIVSLWTVNDDATTRLMSAMYRELRSGTSIATSIRRSQLAFVKKDEHPYFWSSFILIGK